MFIRSFSTTLAVAASAAVYAPPVDAMQLCSTHRQTQAYDTQSICVGNALAGSGGLVYDARSLTDDDPATAWCEGVPGDGIGTKIIIRLKEAAPIQNIWLRNGHAKSPAGFRRNGRVRTMHVTVLSYDVGTPTYETDVGLADDATLQPIALPWEVEHPRYVELRITSVYPGSEFHDTCISDLGVDYGL